MSKFKFVRFFFDFFFQTVQIRKVFTHLRQSPLKDSYSVKLPVAAAAAVVVAATDAAVVAIVNAVVATAAVVVDAAIAAITSFLL
jgi:hypothetical protein